MDNTEKPVANLILKVCAPSLREVVDGKSRAELKVFLKDALTPSKRANTSQHLNPQIQKELLNWLSDLTFVMRPNSSTDERTWKYWLAFALYEVPYFYGRERQTYNGVANLMAGHGWGLAFLMSRSPEEIHHGVEEIWCLKTKYKDPDEDSQYISVIKSIQKGKPASSSDYYGKFTDKNVENWCKEQRRRIIKHIVEKVKPEKEKIATFWQKRKEIINNYRQVFDAYLELTEFSAEPQYSQLFFFATYSKNLFEEEVKDINRKILACKCITITTVILMLLLLPRAFQFPTMAVYIFLIIIVFFSVLVSTIQLFISSATAFLAISNAACNTLDAIFQKIVNDNDHLKSAIHFNANEPTTQLTDKP